MELDIGVKAGRSEEQSSQPLESYYLHQFSDQRGYPVSKNPQTESSDCIQAPVSDPSYIPLSIQLVISLLSQLSRAGIKGFDCVSYNKIFLTLINLWTHNKLEHIYV